MAELKDKSSLDNEITEAIGDRKSYQPNTYKSKDEKKVEKVISGIAKTKKQPLTKKFADVFLAEDIGDVEGYLIFDVLIPAIKETIYEMFNKGLEMIMFGSTSKAQSKKDNRRVVSYDKVSYANSKREASNRARSPRDFRDIILDTRGEAEDVLSNMADLIIDFGSVSVADLYDLVGITGNFTDNKYGWLDLTNAKVRMARGGGYIIDLPRPELLD